jgi:hypothetical protein
VRGFLIAESIVAHLAKNAGSSRGELGEVIMRESNYHYLKILKAAGLRRGRHDGRKFLYNN